MNVFFPLLKQKNTSITKSIINNLPILISYLKKGKQVDKVISSVNKMIKANNNIVKDYLENYLQMLMDTSNKVLFEKGINLIYSYFNKNNLKFSDIKDFVINMLSKYSIHLLKNSKNLNVLYKSNIGVNKGKPTK